MAAASAPGVGMLEGIRVLDLADQLGAYGTRLLAGLGAEVILAEPPAGGPRRTRRSHYDLFEGAGESRGLYYLHYDAGKRGITLDIDSPEGRGVLTRLLDLVDVVVDNGHLAGRGFDLEVLTARRPLVVVSLTPFGLAGTRSHWQGGDLICQVMGGMNQIYGYRNERPMRLGPEQASEMGGLAVALAALIASYGSRADGTGEVVDIALERVCALVTLQMSNASIFHQFGFVRERRPRGSGRRGQLYRAVDGYVVFGFGRDPRAAVHALAQLGVGAELQLLLSEHGETEIAALDESEEAIARAIARVSRTELVEVAQAVGIMSMSVQDAHDINADRFLRDRAFFAAVEHPELGLVFTDAALPCLVDGRRVGPVTRPPLLGEHNDEVLGRAGYGRAEIDALREARVC